MAWLRRRPSPSDPRVAARLEGRTPQGTAAVVEVGPGRRVLLFLTSSCAPCRDVWTALAGLPADQLELLTVVTPDPATESARAVARLTPPGVTVVMSSPAWFSYRPGPAPWRVVVEDGSVVARGPARAGDLAAG